tara:strand:+ start:397 stop:513 length:117 start_codon:yes stop_codon:yes gene_type:complete
MVHNQKEQVAVEVELQELVVVLIKMVTLAVVAVELQQK